MQLEAAYFAGGYIVTAAVTHGLKAIIKRPRPINSYYFIVKREDESGYSFPSGHTSPAFYDAVSLSILYPEWYVIAPSLLWAGSVGYARMYQGVHYPSDVLAGAVVGTGSAWLCYKAKNGSIRKKCPAKGTPWCFINHVIKKAFTMLEININTPALLFPAITLLMLAYTNRFLSLAALVRKLHEEYTKGEKEQNILQQIRNIRSRLNLIRYMQSFGVLSFLCCVLCMYAIFRNWPVIAHWIFAASLVCLLVSIVLSLIEINKSTRAIELQLSDIEDLSKANIFKDIFKPGE